MKEHLIIGAFGGLVMYMWMKIGEWLFEEITK